MVNGPPMSSISTPFIGWLSDHELLSKMNDNDRDYYLECQRYCRDFIRMSHNLRLGVFHPSISPTGVTK